MKKKPKCNICVQPQYMDVFSSKKRDALFWCPPVYLETVASAVPFFFLEDRKNMHVECC